MLRRGSRGFGPLACGLLAQVAVQLSLEAPRHGTPYKMQTNAQFRRIFMKKTLDAASLLHGRKIGRTHIDLVDSKHFAHFIYKRFCSFDVGPKRRVGMKRIPVLFRLFPARVSHDIDERICPGWIFVWYPLTNYVDAVVSHSICSV